jgi:myo-inositol-1(or 4)-monophosphatase
MTSAQLSKLEGVMVAAACKAGELLREKYRNALQIDYKTEREPVSEVDKASEEIIIDTIRKSYPDHHVFSEETETDMDYSQSRDIPLWFIDPLDGTMNFLRGFSFFCVGIGFYDRGTAEAATIYDPVHDELFTARKGDGTKLNGAPVQVSHTETLINALLATGFPFVREAGNDNTDHIAHMVPLCSDLRRTASGLLDLAYTACGRFDGYFEHELGPHDTGPGVLLVHEAGGRVSDYRGEEYHPFKRDLCATNGAIHDRVIEILQKGKSGLNGLLRA